MADWTDITNDALDVGKPTRAVDARALRDNPVAMARGAPNSPSVTPWAMARATIAAGSSVRFSNPTFHFKTAISNRSNGENINLTGNEFPVYAVCVMNSGSIRVGWTQGRVQGTGSGGPVGAVGRVRAGTFSMISTTIGNTNNSNQEDKTYDLTGIQPGDTIVWLFRTASGGNEMQIYNLWLGTSGGVIHPFPAFFTFGATPV